METRNIDLVLAEKLAANKLLNQALWNAAQEGLSIEVKKQIYLGANPNAITTLNNSYTHPLHIALGYNRSECIYLLLVNGANPTQQTAAGHLPAEICRSEVAKVYLSAATHLHSAMELFDHPSHPQILASVAEFTAALNINSKLTIEFIAKLAETITLHETGGYYYDKMFHPAFVSFAIKQLVLILQTQPSMVTDELKNPILDLCSILNAYDVAHYGKNSHRLFENLTEKYTLLSYFEKFTTLQSTKAQCRGNYVPTSEFGLFPKTEANETKEQSLGVRALTLLV